MGTTRKLSEAAIVRRLKDGETITVRAKNGMCIPMFSWKPSAYRSVIGKTTLNSAMVYSLCKRRVITCTNRGWYSEGHFALNRELRDERGRFRKAP